MKKIISVCIIISFSFCLFAQTKIKMKKENGVYYVPCKVNGLKLYFIFDTGASDVCLSLAEATFMLKNGFLDIEDIQGASKSTIADGSIVENTRVLLREIVIGGKKLNNVDAIVIHNIEAPLLLGQSVIERLGKIEINKSELIITEGSYDSFASDSLLRLANSFYDEKLYSAAFKYFNKVYYNNKALFSYKDLYHFGSTCNQLNVYLLSILYFQESLQHSNIPNRLRASILRELAIAYLFIEKHFESVSTCEEACAIINQIENSRLTRKELVNLHKEKADLYYTLGENYLYGYEEYNSAIEYYQKAINNICKAKDIPNYEQLINAINNDNVKDVFLGKCFLKIALCYNELNSLSKTVINFKIAAKLGEPISMEYIENNELPSINKE